MLADLYQAGCLKALFPRAKSQGLSGIFLNNSGGMTGGDQLTLSATAGPDSRLTQTSQAAERVYRAAPGNPAQLSTKLQVESGARIDWLPQETILFNGAAFRRRLDIDLSGDAVFLGVEPVIFGRPAMGERLTEGAFADNIVLKRDGAWIFADATRLSGDLNQSLAGPATGGSASAMAGVIYAAADAEAHLAPLRRLLPETGGVSLIRPGIQFVRILSPDSFVLRQSLIPIMAHQNGADPPKTWIL